MDAIAIAKARAFVAAGAGRAIRKAARLSLADVAEELGVDSSTVHRWETGERTPRGKWVVEYADLLRRLMDAR